MTFQPLLPLSGYAGWRFLSGSLSDQTTRFGERPDLARDMAYFRQNIGNIKSANDLVSDYRLRRISLGAFGLQDDISNKAFIQKVLSDGVTDGGALSNRLADKRYQALSEAFGFGTSLPPRSQSSGFADKILEKFRRQEFERAVGEQSDDMRLALTASRELSEISSRNLSDTASWLTVLGNPPVRKVFEIALGLPSSIGSIDLDQQLGGFRDSSDRLLGSSDFSMFQDSENVEALIRAFTIRAQIASGPSPLTPGLAALTLLQSMS